MDIINLLKSYPSEAAGGIAIVSASIGWTVKSIVNFVMENQKYKKEIKTYFWKEKVLAAKKASEFYLEYLNFLNLVRQQFEMYEKGNIEHQDLFDSIEKEVAFYSDKIKAFPHFEHHHINIFYDFQEERSMAINSNTFEIHQRIYEWLPKKNDSPEVLNSKIAEIKKLSSDLKSNYAELFSIYKGLLHEVRTDLKEYI